ncbi:MAG: hypothetical protein KIS92_11040 [Planctomycetota bacterium]|nr:hypothetical protein [Planctomycetota bacterium]
MPALKRIGPLQALLLCMGLAGAVRAEAPAPPKHAELAAAIAREIKPEHNQYAHKELSIVWKDEANPAYANHTDCSGFLNLLLAKAYDYTPEDLRAWTGRSRPLAKTWRQTIADGKGFAPVAKVADLRAGDVIAIAYEPGNKNTGHVLLAAGPAKQLDAKKPLVEGTSQWEVPVIDSSMSPHGPKDTRRIDAKTSATGVGRGELRLYADAQGAPAGYAWSFYANSEFHAVKERPLAMGRLIKDYKPPAPKDDAAPAPEPADENEGD